MRTSRLAILVAALAVAAPSAGWASGFQQYKVCGGDTFATCAAVSIDVVGSSVTVRVWNLSGNTAATYGTNTWSGTIFNGIGFYNTGSVSAVLGSLSVSGPARPGDTPGNWKLKNGGSTGFTMDFNADAAKTGNHGIASGCATSGQLPSGPDLYMNPCNNGLGNVNNYTTFTFQITGSWDPSTSDFALRGINGPGGIGNATECFTGETALGGPPTCVTVTPEPVTMTLLATGLMGMGGAGFIRRRKQKLADVS